MEAPMISNTLSTEMQLWLIQPDRYAHPNSNVKTILWAAGRADAKRKAKAGWLADMGDPDNYIVTPITNPGDRVKLEIVLNV